MQEDERMSEWNRVLTGLGLGVLSTGAAGFPVDRAHLERALVRSWPDWSGSASYPRLYPRDFSIYAMRSTLMEGLGYVTWEWRHGIRPVLAVESASAAAVLDQFSATSPVSSPEWQELARQVSAELSAGA